MKQLTIAELKPHAQWKANAFPEVLYTKPRSHTIKKTPFYWIHRKKL